MANRSRIKVENRLRNLMITPVVGASTLALPNNSSRSIHQSSFRGASRGSQHGDKSRVSRVSSTKKTLGRSVSHRSRRSDTPEQLDIMKVFHEWYQSAATISNRRNKSSAQSHRQSGTYRLSKTHNGNDWSQAEHTIDMMQVNQ